MLTQSFYGELTKKIHLSTNTHLNLATLKCSEETVYCTTTYPLNETLPSSFCIAKKLVAVNNWHSGKCFGPRGPWFEPQLGSRSLWP